MQLRSPEKLHTLLLSQLSHALPTSGVLDCICEFCVEKLRVNVVCCTKKLAKFTSLDVLFGYFLCLRKVSYRKHISYDSPLVIKKKGSFELQHQPQADPCVSRRYLAISVDQIRCTPRSIAFFVHAASIFPSTRLEATLNRVWDKRSNSNYLQ